MPYSAPQDLLISGGSTRQEFKARSSSGIISPPPTATASTRFKYTAIGAGAGAGSGRQGAPGTNRCGGSGAGPGGITEGEYLLGDLMAIAVVAQASDLRFAINIPEGGKGGASVTTPDTNGNNGNNPIGGNTSIELRNAAGTFAKIIATGANG